MFNEYTYFMYNFIDIYMIISYGRIFEDNRKMTYYNRIRKLTPTDGGGML